MPYNPIQLWKVPTELLRTSLILLAVALITVSSPAAGADSHQHPEPVVLAPGYAALEFHPPPAGSYELPPLGKAADGLITDSRGQRLSLHDLLDDKVVVLSFIYTSCSDVNGCPLASYVLKGISDRLADSAELKQRVRLVSFSFDPDSDSPEVLAAYGDRLRGPDSDWRFVTSPSQSQLRSVLADYDQWVYPDYDARGNYLGTVSHLLRVYLIDTDKRIRNIYSVSFLHADTLLNDIRTLLAEKKI